jgi:hypothetical protein
MLIAFEGVDCSGKSTLIKHVQKILLQRGLISEVVNHGKPAPNAHPLTEYAGSITSRAGRHLIFDRLHVGEEIYGKLYRDGSRLTLAQRVFIDGLLASYGALLVHVTASPDTVVARCQSRGEDYLKSEDVAWAVEEYHRQTVDRRYWITVNTDNHDLDDMPSVAMKLVEIAMTRWLTMSPVIELGTDYVGPRWPQALLVADRPVPTADARTPYGALTPWNGNCADYLFNALYDVYLVAPRRIPRIGWVNSHLTDVKRLYVELGSPSVVALGSEAHKALDRQSVPVAGRVDHPQYVRRFKHSYRAKYGTDIMDIVNSR